MSTEPHELFRLSHEGLDGGRVEQITWYRVGSAVELPHQSIEYLPAGAGDRNGCSLLVQRASDRPSNPA